MRISDWSSDVCSSDLVTVEAVDREKIAVLEVEGARILVRNVQIIDRRGRDDLNARGQRLRAAGEFADEGPTHVGGARGDRARLPARLAAIAGDRGTKIFVAVIDVAAAQSGQGDLMSQPGQPAHIRAEARREGKGGDRKGQ